MMPGARPGPVAILAAALRRHAPAPPPQAVPPAALRRLRCAWYYGTLQRADIAALELQAGHLKPVRLSDDHYALTATLPDGSGLSACINDQHQLVVVHVGDAAARIVLDLPETLLRDFPHVS